MAIYITNILHPLVDKRSCYYNTDTYQSISTHASLQLKIPDCLYFSEQIAAVEQAQNHTSRKMVNYKDYLNTGIYSTMISHASSED